MKPSETFSLQQLVAVPKFDMLLLTKQNPKYNTLNHTVGLQMQNYFLNLQLVDYLTTAAIQDFHKTMQFVKNDTELPDHFNDDELISVLKSSGDNSNNENVTAKSIQYPISLGLIFKIRTGLKRLKKRQKWNTFNIESFMKLLISYSLNLTPLDPWTPEQLFTAVTELSKKVLTISPKIVKKLDYHELHPPDKNTGTFIFNNDFLLEVAAYHSSVARPEGTFTFENEDETGDGISIIRQLAILEREECSGCGTRQQLYCGPCGGLRTPSASALLPKRVELPFDVLLVLHW
eukprot:gene13090-27628_t